MQQIESLALQVEQAARFDFVLKIGNITETVDVVASATLLQTENASVGTVIDASKIVDLPLNGRNFIQLAQLVPGVQAGTPGSITVRRGRSRPNGFSLWLHRCLGQRFARYSQSLLLRWD